jgi:hypothetical protein
MPRKSQPPAWVLAQAEARKAREDTFDAARKANPERYRILGDAVDESSDIYNKIDKKYRALAQAHSDAKSLCYSLKECGLDAEAVIAMDLLAIVDKLLQPLLEPHKIAADNCGLAQSAFDKEFKF